MLYITIPAQELFDESKQEFVNLKEQTLQLEHSLVSISKWESKWCTPFYAKREKTAEETMDYIKCMTITQNVKDEVYERFTRANIDEVLKYIESPMTATTITRPKKSGPNKENVTSELVYHWMIDLGIPFECQKWHINRLLTLIDVRNVKTQPPKKVGKRETINTYAMLNEARKKQLNTRG